MITSTLLVLLFPNLEPRQHAVVAAEENLRGRLPVTADRVLLLCRGWDTLERMTLTFAPVDLHGTAPHSFLLNTSAWIGELPRPDSCAVLLPQSLPTLPSQLRPRVFVIRLPSLLPSAGAGRDVWSAPPR